MPTALLSFLLPCFWARAPDRTRAGGAVLLLYLMAAREQPLAILRVLPQYSPAEALGLWLAHGMLLALPWWLAWQPVRAAPVRRAGALLAALLLGLLPPFGMLGWLHPLTLGGWLYPAWGLTGLAATTVLLLGLTLGATRWTLAFTAAALVANALYRPVPQPSDWVALDTQLPRMTPDAASRMARQLALIAQVEKQLAASPAVVLLPEEIAGPWTAAEAFWWQPTFEAARAHGTTLILGAQRPDPQGWRNGALIVAPWETRWQLARQPIPLAEWHPWADDAAPTGWLSPAHSLATGMADVAGQRVLFSFCYEDLLTLPMLVSALQGPAPQRIVSLANQWWARGMAEPVVQQQTLAAWGRLWGIPVLRAVNRPD